MSSSAAVCRVLTVRGRPTKGEPVPTTVLLVDDHELIRQGLRRAFERSDDFEVVGEAGSRSPRRCARRAGLRPDVMVIDVRLPDGSGLDLVRAIRKRPRRHRHRRPHDVRRRRAALRRARRGRQRLRPEGRAHRRRRSPPPGTPPRRPRAFTANDLSEAMKRRLAPTGPQLSPREKEVLAAARRRPRRRADLQAALHQRVDDQDPHLQALREARRGQPGAGPHVGAAARADHPGRPRRATVTGRGERPTSTVRTVVAARRPDRDHGWYDPPAPRAALPRRGRLGRRVRPAARGDRRRLRRSRSSRRSGSPARCTTRTATTSAPTASPAPRPPVEARTSAWSTHRPFGRRNPERYGDDAANPAPPPWSQRWVRGGFSNP